MRIAPDRLGRDLRRDLGEEMDREFEHRAFLVDHAVELAVSAAAEMAAARQFADILADTGDLERLAVDAGVMQIDVPDETAIGRKGWNPGLPWPAAKDSRTCR